MNDRELEIFLNDLESDRVERKASISDRSKISEAICAFANDLPNHRQSGVIFIGANDDGTCSQLNITDELLRILADMRSAGNILPIPTMTGEKKTLGGCELALTLVEPSDAPPVRYGGRTWIRVGPRRAIATAEEERRLTEKRSSRDLPFDIRPISSVDLEALDFNLFHQVYLPSSIAPDILEQNQRTDAEQLASLRFATVEPMPRPTILGILVVGKDP